MLTHYVEYTDGKDDYDATICSSCYYELSYEILYDIKFHRETSTSEDERLIFENCDFCNCDFSENKKRWGIKTRHLGGTVIYFIGEFTTKEEAYQDAIKNFAWFAINPNIDKIITVDEMIRPEENNAEAN